MRRTLVLAAIAMLVAGCTVTRGSGVLTSERRDVSGFDRIDVSGSARVDVTIGSEWSVVVEADDNIVPLITTTVTGDTLDIGTKSNTSFMTSNPIQVSITMPALTAVDVSGSGEITADDVGSAQDFTAEISGSGDVSVIGKVDRLDVSVSGSGNFDGRRLETVDATVSVSGSGEAVVWATGNLDAKVSGSGDIRYLGSPGNITTDVSGSGRIINDG
jgi:hypothetical protein